MVEGIDDKYKAKLTLLSSCCEKLQKENETIAHKILQSKHNLRKARKLRMRLLQKLDDVGDQWRLELEQIKDNPPNTKISSQVYNDDGLKMMTTTTTPNSNLTKNNNSQGITNKSSKAKCTSNNLNFSKSESKPNKTVSDKTKPKNLYQDSSKNMNGNLSFYSGKSEQF